MTFVSNHGFDGSGSHGRGLFRDFAVNADKACEVVPAISKNLVQDLSAYALVAKAIRRSNGGWLGKFVDILRRLIGS